MKRKRMWAFLAILIVGGTMGGAERAGLWREVEDALKKRQPRTAATNLDLILPAAVRDGAHGEAARAVALRVSIEGEITDMAVAAQISLLESRITNAPLQVRPILRSIEAHWLWNYYRMSPWRFLARTALAQSDDRDFATWDLPRLFAEIDRQLTVSLQPAATLQAMPVAEFDSLLERGDIPENYRPTLYDFLAHEALSFYTAENVVRARPENWLEFEADKPVYGVVPLFGTVEEFLAGAPARPEDASSAVNALFLFRDLLRFHGRDPDPVALIHVDLCRLAWAHTVAKGDARGALYRAALERLVERWPAQAIVTEVIHARAALAQTEGNLLEARKWAGRGAETHPESRGSERCRAMLREIESPRFDLAAEYVWNSKPVIRLSYCNITNINFRVIPVGLPEMSDPMEDPARHLNHEPVKRWAAALAPTPDFQARTATLEPPSGIAQGLYLLVASLEPNEQDEKKVNQVPFCVSDLAVVIRTRRERLEGFVLDAQSGEPLAGAEVAVWDHHEDANADQPDALARSDADGLFGFGDSVSSLFRILRARLGDRELVLGEVLLHGGEDDEEAGRQLQTFVFTDRALYRPGQVIQYKGICVSADPSLDQYGVVQAPDIVVALCDHNEKEIARQKHRANDYGSFSGSFTAPRDRLTGTMYIRVVNGPSGQASIQVEEYKRPKFKVTLTAPKEPPRLNEMVLLSGKAEAFSGAAVDGAVVQWRVEREVQCPEWAQWWNPWTGFVQDEVRLLGRGTAKTERDGTFQIAFRAVPDHAISPTNEPVFLFKVYADVTDPAGETRSAERTTQVGYAAMSITVEAIGWQTVTQPVELAVRTTSLDGVGVSANGVLRVFRVLEPPAVLRRPPTGPFSEHCDPEEEARAWAASPDPTDPLHWPLGELVVERAFQTDPQGGAVLPVLLPLGLYRVVAETEDRFGTAAKAMTMLTVIDPQAPRLALKLHTILEASSWTVEPGQDFVAIWGTGYDAGRAFVEVEHRGRMIQRFWTDPGKTQQAIKVPVTESMRGGFTLHLTQVRENRAYLFSQRVDVPWSNKALEVRWEHFVSLLRPGTEETWSLVIRPPANTRGDALPERDASEMVATLFDASLDLFRKHEWAPGFEVFHEDHSSLAAESMNGQLMGFSDLFSFDGIESDDPGEFKVRRFRRDLVLTPMRDRRRTSDLVFSPPPMSIPAPALSSPDYQPALTATLSMPRRPASPKMARPVGSIDRGSSSEFNRILASVTARKNLNETAFFYPQLLSDSNGVVKLTFTMPEALTTWRLLGFAHDQDLRAGLIEAEAVTAKDLMVQPNPPRFLREGDELEFSVKVSNQSTNRQTGKVKLELRYAANDAPADKDLKLAGLLSSGRTGATELDFDIPAKESRTFSWRLEVPDGCGFLAYKAVGATAKMSDGEEGWLPVLSRRILVTESLPLPIRGKVGGGEAVKKFELEKLLKSGRSSTLRHQSYTVQMVSQPAWYAVMALPYLMEFPYECSEQVFNRFYANALARHIALKDPKIRRVFDQWKGTAALDSPLEKNQDLKAVMLEETPWVRQAQKESEGRRNVGVLFDENRLTHEQAGTLRKLVEMQGGDGLWPWFPGGRGNDYITLYIVTGFGRLRHLGLDLEVQAALKALNRLDAWMEERYREIKKMTKPEDYVPGSTECLFLYGRSFFLKDKALAGGPKEAVDFFLARARDHWLKVANRQNQGHLALALERFGGQANEASAREIVRSLRERSVRQEEMGMFWRETELSWWWYRAPIETQAMMIEVFDEVGGDRDAVEECRVWLLKQKQTQDWKTTKATADAVYALLLRGGNLLAGDKLVEVKVGGINVTPGKARTEGTSQPEAGTGFYERRFGPGEIKPAMGEITVRKVDEGVSWGSVHWQYLEDMTKVTPYEGTPLKLKKALYRRVNTGQGPTLEPVKGALGVGDELVVRIELRVDRDMEYVHLKDQRGSGTEPVNVLSGYRYQDGLAYYESTRDTASHFFIDYLPKGTYVFEYASRVQHRGQYQTGMASIQCMYAPEFNSHSESHALVVK